MNNPVHLFKIIINLLHYAQCNHGFMASIQIPYSNSINSVIKVDLK